MIEPPKFQLQNVDELLTREETAQWFGQTERWLEENKDTIVPFRPSHRVVVYHPRTILAKMAFDAGVPIQLIAASFGMQPPPSPKV